MHILLFFQMEDRQKIDFQLIEAKRQQRKLNFLITQTEIFAHFMANKVGTESQDETEILGQLDEKTPLPLTTMVDDYDSTVIKEQVKENALRALQSHDMATNIYDQETDVSHRNDEANEDRPQPGRSIEAYHNGEIPVAATLLPIVKQKSSEI